MLAIRLPPEIEERLEKLARKTGRTKTYYARQAILDQLDDLEDYYLAEKRMADVAAGKSELIPLADILKEHGLED
ncbi:MAG: TraY domain-containing protein [Alphaproteobacteria bacterium]|nr:TraY domain-containing protein [Alphaproteobacteria bacterium]